MNRKAALLLALTTLLAHGLLIHQDGNGAFAPPYDSAHVAFRMARNLVQEGTLDWNPATGDIGHYPSPLWIAICVLAERLYLPVTTFAQTFGMLCTLLTVVCVARFTSDRLAGVIAPILLVVNGGVAAAGTGGTEVALLTLLVTASFLAREERSPRTLAALLALLVLARPEGTLAVVCFAALEIFRRLRGKSATLARSFVPAAVLLGVLIGLRWHRSGSPFSPGLFDGNPVLGLRYLKSFFLGAGSPLLVFVPLAILIRGRLVGRARRALLFTMAWILWVGWSGGDDLPFWNAVVPTLPLLFLAVQDGMTIALDARRPAVFGATLVLFSAGIGASVLASKLPGRIGVLPDLPTAESWSSADPILAEAYGEYPGRRGLLRRLNQTQRLRTVGIFLRDNLEDHMVVLTAWPGSIGYLSKHTVHDLLGRVTPSPSGGPHNPWHGTPRGDVLEALSRQPDFVVAWIEPMLAVPDQGELIEQWLTSWDRFGPSPERTAAVEVALEPYEVVSVSVPKNSAHPERPSEFPVTLLRRRDLRMTPQVRIHRTGADFIVDVRHRGHTQLVDLEVTATDRDGVVWYMRPTGEFQREHPSRARKRIQLHTSGSRRVELVHGTLTEGILGARVRAVLRNPQAEGPWTSEASNEAGPPR